MTAEFLGAAGILTAVAALLASLWQGYLLRCQLGHFDRVSRAQFSTDYDDVHTARSNFYRKPRSLAVLLYWTQGTAEESATGQSNRHWPEYWLIWLMALQVKRSKAISTQHWNKYYQYRYENSPSLQKFREEHGRFWPEETRRRFIKNQVAQKTI